MTLSKETWKDIDGFNGLYQVSNYGKVRSNFHGKGYRILKPSINSPKYYYITLYDGFGKRKNIQIHRLVAEYFLNKIEGKECVNHKDCNRLNNCVDNLEWCTSKENNIHARINNRFPKKETGEHDNGRSKIVLDMQTGIYYNSCKEAAFFKGITKANLSHMLRGKIKNKSSLIYV